MSTPILNGASATEKCAYISVIASIATSDQSASETEISYLGSLADQAGLTAQDKEKVIFTAKDTTGSTLKPSLDILKSSELRFSLMADLLAFAESDNNLSAEEKAHIGAVADYLGIDKNQMEALSHYVQEAAAQPAAMGIAGGSSATEGMGFLDSLGIGEKLQGAGINMGSLAKGLISFVGPMIMGNMINKGMNSGNAGLNEGGLKGGLGSLLGGLTGGKGLSGIGGFLTSMLK